MSNEKIMRSCEEDVRRASLDYGRNMVRVAERGEIFHIFQGLEGVDIFFAGHRFHLLGTVARIEIDPFGDPVIFLDNVHQIDYDEPDDIPNAYYLGDGFRIPASAVGLGVQPISQRSRGYQEAWARFKERQTSAP